MIIGIDLDNTIIDHSSNFIVTAEKFGFVKKDFINSCQNLQKKSIKEILKKNIISQKNGRKQWEFLQGQVYGNYLKNSKVFIDFYKFLVLCKINSYRVYIISHKSKFAHQDPKKNLIRKSSKIFLKKNYIFNNFFGIDEQNIFFCDSVNKKIEKINQLNCNYFIDDLPKIFNNKKFPKKTKQILFSPISNYNSNRISLNWKIIINKIFVNQNIKLIVKKFSSFLINEPIKKIEKINHGNNSHIYKINFLNGNNYIGKLYPTDNSFSLSRILNENKTYNFLEKSNIQKNSLIKIFDKKLNFSLIEFHSGKQIKKMNFSYLKKFIKFIKDINKQNYLLENSFHNASAACLSFDQLKKQIIERLRDHNRYTFVDKKYKSFLNKQLKPNIDQLIIFFEKKWPYETSKILNKKYRILSPSDFGLHNSIIKKNSIEFIDFEYFGWDDPVKLTCDFILHPAMKLSDNHKQYWIKQMCYIFNDDPHFKNRLYASYYLYSICWCLIMLNDFKIDKNEFNNYNFKNNNKRKLKLQIQLNKSKSSFKTILLKYKKKISYE